MKTRKILSFLLVISLAVSQAGPAHALRTLQPQQQKAGAEELRDSLKPSRKAGLLAGLILAAAGWMGLSGAGLAPQALPQEPAEKTVKKEELLAGMDKIRKLQAEILELNAKLGVPEDRVNIDLVKRYAWLAERKSISKQEYEKALPSVEQARVTSAQGEALAHYKKAAEAKTWAEREKHLAAFRKAVDAQLQKSEEAVMSRAKFHEAEVARYSVLSGSSHKIYAQQSAVELKIARKDIDRLKETRKLVQTLFELGPGSNLPEGVFALGWLGILKEMPSLGKEGPPALTEQEKLEKNAEAVDSIGRLLAIWRDRQGLKIEWNALELKHISQREKAKIITGEELEVVPVLRAEQAMWNTEMDRLTAQKELLLLQRPDPKKPGALPPAAEVEAARIELANKNDKHHEAVVRFREAELELAEKRYERQEALFNRSATSKSEYEITKSFHALAKERLAKARKQLENRRDARTLAFSDPVVPTPDPFPALIADPSSFVQQGPLSLTKEQVPAEERVTMAAGRMKQRQLETLRAEILEAEARVAVMASFLERAERLVKGNSISLQEYEEYKSWRHLGTVEEAKADHRKSQMQLIEAGSDPAAVAAAWEQMNKTSRRWWLALQNWSTETLKYQKGQLARMNTARSAFTPVEFVKIENSIAELETYDRLVRAQVELLDEEQKLPRIPGTLSFTPYRSPESVAAPLPSTHVIGLAAKHRLAPPRFSLLRHKDGTVTPVLIGEGPMELKNIHLIYADRFGENVRYVMLPEKGPDGRDRYLPEEQIGVVHADTGAELPGVGPTDPFGPKLPFLVYLPRFLPEERLENGRLYVVGILNQDMISPWPVERRRLARVEDGKVVPGNPTHAMWVYPVYRWEKSADGAYKNRMVGARVEIADLKERDPEIIDEMSNERVPPFMPDGKDKLGRPVLDANKIVYFKEDPETGEFKTDTLPWLTWLRDGRHARVHLQAGSDQKRQPVIVVETPLAEEAKEQPAPAEEPKVEPERPAVLEKAPPVPGEPPVRTAPELSALSDETDWLAPYISERERIFRQIERSQAVLPPGPEPSSVHVFVEQALVERIGADNFLDLVEGAGLPQQNVHFIKQQELAAAKSAVLDQARDLLRRGHPVLMLVAPGYHEPLNAGSFNVALLARGSGAPELLQAIRDNLPTQYGGATPITPETASYLVKGWDTLSAEQRLEAVRSLAEQGYSLEKYQQHRSLVLRSERGEPSTFKAFPPSLDGRPGAADWHRLVRDGKDPKVLGKIGIIIAAAGEGTRLLEAAAKDGQLPPNALELYTKPTVPVMPVTGESSLGYQLKVIADEASTRGVPLPVMPMLHPEVGTKVGEWIERNGDFGLPHLQARFQGMNAALDAQGLIVLKDDGSVSMNPDGTGGVIRAALADGGAEWFESILGPGAHVQVINGDNLLDPELIEGEAGASTEHPVVGIGYNYPQQRDPKDPDPKTNHQFKLGTYVTLEQEDGSQVVKVVEYRERPAVAGLTEAVLEAEQQGTPVQANSGMYGFPLDGLLEKVRGLPPHHQKDKEATGVTGRVQKIEEFATDVPGQFDAAQVVVLSVPQETLTPIKDAAALKQVRELATARERQRAEKLGVALSAEARVEFHPAMNREGRLVVGKNVKADGNVGVYVHPGGVTLYTKFQPDKPWEPYDPAAKIELFQPQAGQRVRIPDNTVFTADGVKTAAGAEERGLVIFSPETFELGLELFAQVRQYSDGRVPVAGVVENPYEADRIMQRLEAAGMQLAMPLVVLSETGETAEEAMLSLQLQAWASGLEDTYMVQVPSDFRALGRFLGIPGISERTWEQILDQQFDFQA